MGQHIARYADKKHTSFSDGKSLTLLTLLRAAVTVVILLGRMY